MQIVIQEQSLTLSLVQESVVLTVETAPFTVSIQDGINALLLQGRTIGAAVPNDGQALLWSAADSSWIPGTIQSSSSYTKAEADARFEAIDGTVDWARLVSVPTTFPPSAHTHPWTDIISTPTTLAGYGITDGVTLTTADGRYFPLTGGAFPWSGLTGVPATFPPSAHTHPWTDITSTPITIAGYGITDAFTQTVADARYYTQTQADSRYLQLAGGQLTGPISIGTGLTPTAMLDLGVGGQRVQAYFDQTRQAFGLFDAPTVTQVGTPGTTKKWYWVIAVDARGRRMNSFGIETDTSNATLSTTNYNHLDWTGKGPQTGVAYYQVYRHPSSFALSSANKIGDNILATTFDDQTVSNPVFNPVQTAPYYDEWSALYLDMGALVVGMMDAAPNGMTGPFPTNGTNADGSSNTFGGGWRLLAQPSNSIKNIGNPSPNASIQFSVAGTWYTFASVVGANFMDIPCTIRGGSGAGSWNIANHGNSATVANFAPGGNTGYGLNQSDSTHLAVIAGGASRMVFDNVGGIVVPTADMSFTHAGSGIILTTPDGTHTYRISIDNTGALTTTLVT